MCKVTLNRAEFLGSGSTTSQLKSSTVKVLDRLNMALGGFYFKNWLKIEKRKLEIHLQLLVYESEHDGEGNYASVVEDEKDLKIVM